MLYIAVAMQEYLFELKRGSSTMKSDFTVNYCSKLRFDDFQKKLYRLKPKRAIVPILTKPEEYTASVDGYECPERKENQCAFNFCLCNPHSHRAGIVVFERLPQAQMPRVCYKRMPTACIETTK